MYPTEPIPEHGRIDELLRSVDRPGDYCVGGRIFTPMPRVIVEGAGELSFPVPEAQVEALIAAAERSPYGKGAETVLDTSVRDSWQIDAADVRLDGRAWPDSLAKIMDMVAAGLGLPAERLGAELYKLLVYRPGGFFAEHRDTEKVPGMVATLSLSLPTPGAGGELVVRHAAREATLDMAALEPSELLFAAFYSDCPHEVLPVRDGHRVSLLFNLFLGSADDGLAPPEYRKLTTQVAESLARWRDGGRVDKLAWVLDHEYSEDGLSFDTLKNKDAAVAKVLAKAARRTGCELHAAVLGIEEEGYPDESPPYDWDGPIENAPQAEIGELRSRIRTLDGWAACDGGRPRFGPIDLKASELLSRRALTDAEPDERRVYPTGNEGVTMALVYRHGALVVWPGDKTLDIVAGNSVGHAVSWVATQRGRPADGADEGVRRLLARLIRIWPARSWSTRSQDRYEMLRLLYAVGDGDLGADFLQRVVTTHYDGSENVVLAEVLALIGAGEVGAFLPKLIERHLARRPKEIVALLVLAGGSPKATTDRARRDAMREAAENRPVRPGARSSVGVRGSCSQGARTVGGAVARLAQVSRLPEGVDRSRGHLRSIRARASAGARGRGRGGRTGHWGSPDDRDPGPDATGGGGGDLWVGRHRGDGRLRCAVAPIRRLSAGAERRGARPTQRLDHRGGDSVRLPPLRQAARVLRGSRSAGGALRIPPGHPLALPPEGRPGSPRPRLREPVARGHLHAGLHEEPGQPPSAA